MSAVSSKWGQRGPRYRRRRPLPGLVLLAVLVVLAGFLWTKVFESVEDVEAATRCNPPSPPTASPNTQQGGGQAVQSASGQPQQANQQQGPNVGTMLSRDSLDRTNPTAPGNTHVRVLNANGESQQASLVADELDTLGFASGGSPSNDPIYQNYDLNCHAQIRFGDSGAPAARTLSMVIPCAQLVRTERPGGNVDLALGSEFDEVQTTQEGKQILQELQSSPPGSGGAQTQRIDPELLEKARDVHC